MNIYACHVCGLMQDEPPWGEDGKAPTFDFCSCCGVEFGYQDCFYETMKRYRHAWLRGGAKWDTPKDRPADWNLWQQLEAIAPDEESVRLTGELLKRLPLNKE